MNRTEYAACIQWAYVSQQDYIYEIAIMTAVIKGYAEKRDVFKVYKFYVEFFIKRFNS